MKFLILKVFEGSQPVLEGGGSCTSKVKPTKPSVPPKPCNVKVCIPFTGPCNIHAC